MNSMKVTKNLGHAVVGHLAHRDGPLLNPGFSGLGTLMASLAIAAGALILVGR